MKNANLLSSLSKYLDELAATEKAKNTMEKYHRDILKFINHIDCKKITREKVVTFKSEISQEYTASSANSILSAVNGFLEFRGLANCKVKLLKIQREVFTSPEKELTKAEYERLVKSAKTKKNKQLPLIIQTICSCGIRVSELEFLTVNAIHSRQMMVTCKNKKRAVLLPTKLCHELMLFCKEKGIKSGIIFKTKNGKPLDRSNIWKMMKNLCKTANVAKSKVFPHNLRHLFARTYYKLEKDISRLADILGHSNINTTRIYIIETGKTHQKQINKMALIL